MLWAPTMSLFSHRPQSRQAHERIVGLASRVAVPSSTHVGHIVEVSISSTNTTMCPFDAACDSKINCGQKVNFVIAKEETEKAEKAEKAQY